MGARPLVAKLVLTAFIVAALFGIYGMVSPSHAGHGGCPFSSNQHSLCATPLEHLGHWQTVFTAIFAQILVLFALAIVFFAHAALTADTLRAALWRHRERWPQRPALLQELFSQGILHGKEPQVA